VQLSLPSSSPIQIPHLGSFIVTPLYTTSTNQFKF
jgi:hypothetical protein